jgi:uncharacterized protein YbjT (DUF2867 family)
VSVVVTGGKRRLGSELVAELRTRGVNAIPASRRTGFNLATGKGVSEVLADADVVVHAASHPLQFRRVDLNGTRRMIRLLKDAGRSPHLIYVSIVGCDRNPYPYYRAKWACEMVLAKSGLPVTVVRATQFHNLIAAAARTARWPVAIGPLNAASQPCERRWVAEQLADITLGPAPDGYRRATDLAGPDVITVPEAIRMVCERDGRRVPRVMSLPAIGGSLSAFAARTNLPGRDVVIGGKSFADWLREGSATPPSGS